MVACASGPNGCDVCVFDTNDAKGKCAAQFLIFRTSQTDFVIYSRLQQMDVTLMCVCGLCDRCTLHVETREHRECAHGDWCRAVFSASNLHKSAIANFAGRRVCLVFA